MPEPPHTRDMRTPHTRQTTHVAPQSKPQAVGLQALSRWERRPPQTRHQDKLQIHIQGHHDTTYKDTMTPGQTPDATHKDTMTPHTGITQEVAGSRTPGTVQLEALDHHTLWNQDAVTSDTRIQQSPYTRISQSRHHTARHRQ